MSVAPQMEAPQTALEWALYYYSLGWSVVPVHPGEKIPAEKWARFQTTPADPAQIRAWFDYIPDCGIGLVQGRAAGTIVLDFDGDLGHQTLAELEAKGLPMTTRQITPGGGVHVLLRHPGGRVVTRIKVLPGMDVRGDGGFIVAAPSVHPSGRFYAWDVDNHPDDIPVADCPTWLVGIISAPVQGDAAHTEITRAAQPGSLVPLEVVTDGREAYMRDTLLAVASEMRNRLGRLPTEDELVSEAWPQYARKVDFSRPGRGPDEFRIKARYTLARAQAGAIRGFEEPPAGAETAEPGAEEYGEAPSTAEPPLPLIYYDDVAANVDCADFVEDLLTEGAMSVVYGPSNCGKTFFATDLGLHVALGWTWRDRETEVGAVIYCALEGSHGISNRIAAFKVEHGVAGGVPFAIVPVSINLLDPNADRGKLVETIRIAAAKLGLAVKLVVVDTLSRAMAGGNENAPDDMGALVASADFIRQAVNCHLMFVHHSGKDDAKGARGHSLLRAATDTEIEISRQDPNSPSVAVVTKQREMEIEGEFVFGLKRIDLGTNRRGKPVTSCVVEAVEGSAPARLARLSGVAQAGLVALQEALAKSGQSVTERDIPPETPVVWLSAWRSEFYARSALDSQASKRQAFNRSTKDLLDSRKVMILNDKVWTT